jgi:hypothetical protein
MFVGVTDDFDSLEENFKNGIYPKRSISSNYRYKASLALMAEITDNIEARYAYYKWPQLSRVKYENALINKSFDRVTTRYVKRSVDWLVENFKDLKYTFQLDLNEDGSIKGVVNENGMKYAECVFKNSFKGIVYVKKIADEN